MAPTMLFDYEYQQIFTVEDLIISVLNLKAALGLLFIFTAFLFLFFLFFELSMK